MRTHKTAPPYTQLRSSGYYFRFSVPESFRASLHQRELKYSLRTNSKLTAKHRAARLAGLLHEVFQTVSPDDLSPKQIRDLVMKELARWLRNHKDWELSDSPRTPAQAATLVKAYEATAADYRTMLATGDFGPLENETRELLQTQGTELPPAALHPLAPPPTTPEAATLLHQARSTARELAEAHLEFFNVLAHRRQGDYGYERRLFDSGSHNPQSGVALSLEQTPLLSVLWPTYVKDKKASGEWKPDTAAGHESFFVEFLEVVGDLPVGEVTRETIKKYREALQQLPKSAKKKRDYRNKSIAELLSMDIPEKDRLSPRTINERLIRAITFFKWCVKEAEVITNNPAEGISVKSRSKSREPFTLNELQLLFNSDEYAKGKHRKSWQFWSPLLALYTGARQNEIAQLRVLDIRDQDGVTLINITDEAEGASIKSDAGFRQTPVHAELINIGFLEYVEALRKAGEEQLFPDLNSGNHRPGHTVSAWFNRDEKRAPGYLVRCGIDKRDGKKVFHSFRNTVINRLMNDANVPLERVQFLVGHEHSSMGATQSYYKGTLANSIDAIQRLDYGLDHSPLQGQWRKYIPDTE